MLKSLFSYSGKILVAPRRVHHAVVDSLMQVHGVSKDCVSLGVKPVPGHCAVDGSAHYGVHIPWPELDSLT